jgi:hypothetical protein
VRALAVWVKLNSGDLTEDIREMTTLCCEWLDPDVSTIEPFLALAGVGNIKEIADEPGDQASEKQAFTFHIPINYVFFLYFLSPGASLQFIRLFIALLILYRRGRAWRSFRSISRREGQGWIQLEVRASFTNYLPTHPWPKKKGLSSYPSSRFATTWRSLLSMLRSKVTLITRTCQRPDTSTRMPPKAVSRSTS